MYLVAAILKNGRHFEFWYFFRWLTGFIKRAISKECVCQFWCLFPEMKDSYDILLLSAPLYWNSGVDWSNAPSTTPTTEDLPSRLVQARGGGSEAP